MEQDGVNWDFSRPPNQKERAQLQRRRNRLDIMSESVRQATGNMKRLAGTASIDAVRLRYAFVFRASPPPGDPSDRRLPPRAHRPPAARLISPRGAALRFFLSALFEAQIWSRPGQQPTNARPLEAGGDVITWTDLIASDAQRAGTGVNYISVSAKKSRQVKSALKRLADEDLVLLTREGAAGNKYEEFRLLHEGGRRVQGPNVLYAVPLNEQVFSVPVSLFTCGWIHVLEDTELAFILMLATYHSVTGGQAIRIPSEERLLKFGIGRDAYEAHKLLSHLHLATVTIDTARHLDGKVEGFKEGTRALPHTLGFQPGGFEQDALTTLRRQIDYQLGR